MNSKETRIALIAAITAYALCETNIEFLYSALTGKLVEHEEQLCREQRQICAKLVYYKSENIVLNAPMPEI